MAWIETYRQIGNIKPLFCIAYSQDVTIFLPLVLWKQNWKNAYRRLIAPVGFPDFDYHDPLINTKELSEEMMQKFWREFKKSFLLQKVRFDSFILDGLHQHISFSWHSKPGEKCPFIQISHFSDGEEFLQSLNARLRSDIQRQIRRLQHHGELRIIIHKDILTLEQTFVDFLQTHSQRWPKVHKVPNFHHNLIKWGLQNGFVHFSELKSGDQTISWHLGFSYKSRYYYYMPAFNPEWQNYSPGKILIYKLVEEAIEKGIEVFDFLRGDENYKWDWTQGTQELHQIYLHHRNMSGRFKRLLLTLKNKLKHYSY
jgi:CelD/BcsL family acetyltransferase involved in cellulose biosynthesis